MKWERVTIVSRLVSLLFGLIGVPITWWLYSASQAYPAEKVSLEYIVLSGIGALMFLFVGIVGRYPNPSAEKRDGRE